MSITGVLGRGWGSPTDWSRIDPRNNGKDRPDQAKDASCSGSTKELRRSEAKADGVRGWGQSYAQGLTLERGRTIRLELPQELSRVHHTFHVSNLKKCYADEPLVMPLEGIHVDDKLQFVEEPVEIMEREIKRLKRSRIPLVKVRWNSRRGPEFTWEREDSFKQKYPQLFTNRASSSATRGLFTQIEAVTMKNEENNSSRYLPACALVSAAWYEPLHKGVTFRLGGVESIGDDGFNVGNIKAKSIRDPRIKLAHRCITMTITGRKETTNRVTKIDLFYLYCIFGEGVVCNIPYWLAKYLKGVRDKSVIFGRMFVTKISWSFGLLTEEMVSVLNREPPPHVYRKKSLVKMRVIMELHEGECCWPATRGVVEEDAGDDEEGDGERGNEGAGGSADNYWNMSAGDWQVQQAR
ncbi:hypothetical protein Tco_0838856 [Tanacetum coccineum]|uniref:Reverse transcriptase domain-containing protein n=1 Tax=Tanacetum coccineum TaxID=301880 RepID=A0ABQ5ATH7_9ASTR